MIRKMLKKMTGKAASGTQPSNAGGFRTSISDDMVYPDFCGKAAHDSRLFAQFRARPEYTRILEHVPTDLGLLYLQEIPESSRAFQHLREASKNDLIGSPHTMVLDSGLKISPTTLRYVKVSYDLEVLFGDLEGFRVCEIGVGYGGQCRIMDSLFNIDSYTLVDLRPVLELAERFLDHFPLRCQVTYRTMNELGRDQEFDLILSNYSFTELTRVVQEVFLAKVIQHSHRGYITYNEISPPEFRSMTRDAIRERVMAEILDERPLTSPKNCLIVWGHKKLGSQGTARGHGSSSVHLDLREGH
jgi:putative sugar O-methyltransferase